MISTIVAIIFLTIGILDGILLMILLGLYMRDFIRYLRRKWSRKKRGGHYTD